jgi:hypothetical protein
MLLKPTERDAQTISLPDNKNVEVIFNGGQDKPPFHVVGKLNHATAHGLGFVFESTPPLQVLRALQEQVKPSPLAIKPIPNEIAEVHIHCVQALESALSPLRDLLPEQICEGLTKLASSLAGNSSGQYAALPVEKHVFQSPIEQFYLHALEQAKTFVVPDLSLQPEPGAIYTQSRQQRLLFDDWMNLIDKVIQLDTKHETILRLLESRFSLLTQQNIMSHDNPFGPSVLYHTFHYTLRDINLSNSQRKRVYEIFTQLLDKRLDRLYTDLRILSKPFDTLKDNPVSSPNLANGNNKLASPLKENNYSPSSAATTAAIEKETVTEMNSANTSPLAGMACIPPPPDAFTAFVVLFRYVDTLANKSPMETLTDIERSSVIAALRKLQMEEPQQIYFNAPNLQLNLSKIFAETDQENLLNHTEVNGNLQIIGLLTEAMLADVFVTNSMARYIRKLQIPLFIISFNSPQLLYGNTHPARQIINQLETFIQATNNQGEIEGAELRKSLDAVFDRISQNADKLHELEEALESLKKLSAPLLKAYATRLERVEETCDGGQRLRHARRIVDREIDNSIGGKSVPYVIPELLDIGWRQLLVLTCLRVGTDNNSWRKELSAIDLLVNWLLKKPQATPPNPSNVDCLIQLIKDGLSSIGTTQEDIRYILDRINNTLQQPSDLLPSYTYPPTIDANQEDKESSLRNRLRGFQIGDWLKFASTGTTWTPLRLTWAGEDPPHYVFTNRKGMKALEIDADKFVKLLNDKKASRMDNLDELGLLERSAKSLLSTLRERLR